MRKPGLKKNNHPCPEAQFVSAPNMLFPMTPHHSREEGVCSPQLPEQARPWDFHWCRQVQTSARLLKPPPPCGPSLPCAGADLGEESSLHVIPPVTGHLRGQRAGGGREGGRGLEGGQEGCGGWAGTDTPGALCRTPMVTSLQRPRPWPSAPGAAPDLAGGRQVTLRGPLVCLDLGPPARWRPGKARQSPPMHCGGLAEARLRADARKPWGTRGRQPGAGPPRAPGCPAGGQTAARAGGLVGVLGFGVDVDWQVLHLSSAHLGHFSFPGAAP